MEDHVLQYARRRREAAVKALHTVKAAFDLTGARFCAPDATKKEDAAHQKNIALFWAASRAKDIAESDLWMIQRAVEYAKRVEDEIRLRAYYISLSDDSGTELDNWLRAERDIVAATPVGQD